jgi:hypothetical protein
VKTRLAFFLLGTFVLLGLVAVLADRAEKRQRTTATTGKLLSGLDPAKAVRLEIKSKGATAVVEKKEGSWKVVPDGFSADDTAVKDAIEKLARLEKGSVVSENPAKHEALEVKDGDPRTTEVLVTIEGGKEPAAHLFVGKTGADFQSNFVRLKGEDRVYQTQESIRSALDRGDRGWRDRTVLKLAPGEVAGIELASPAGRIALGREAADGAPWTILEPAPGGPARAEAVDGLLRGVENLQADGFAAAALATDPTATGLEAPEALIRFTLKDGRAFEIRWGKETAPSSGRFYARRGDAETVYELLGYRKTALLPALDTLAAAPSPPPVPAPEASPPAAATP